MLKYFFLFLVVKKILFLIFISNIFLFAQPSKIILGADKILNEEKQLIVGKRIGLVTNHTAILSNGQHLIDAIYNDPELKLTALFGPEHGIRGIDTDGTKISDSIDTKTGVPIYSLYGSRNRPTMEMLSEVDVLVFDIQDVGARFYTYVSTLILCMESAAEKEIPFILLDRPNPIRGVIVDGPIRSDSLQSFVSWLPIPIQHGMTFGEIALMANNLNWLRNNLKTDLQIVKFEGWRRTTWFDETTLNWISPSPNMKTLKTATVYPGLCLIEGTNISEGRGTETPFELIGAPWIDGEKLAGELNLLKLPGVKFIPKIFTPVEIPSVASSPKYKNDTCSGIFIKVTNRNIFQPIKTAIAVIAEVQKLYPADLKFYNRRFDQLAGLPFVREEIQKGTPYNLVNMKWKKDVESFLEKRAKYLIYND